MAKPRQDRRSLVLLLVVVLGLLLLINVTSGERKQLTPVEDALLALFAPVQSAFSSAGQSLQDLYDAAVSFHELKAENERLQEEIDILRAQLVHFHEMQKQNHRYRSLLGFAESSGYELLAAEVISRDPSQWFGTLTINRGYLDGVQREMAVITDRGLVGMVSTVSPNSSQIILITDPRLSVSARVQRTRDPGIVGTVESNAGDPSMLIMTNMPPETSIQPGDMIVTSGMGGIFPPGLYIGMVKERPEERSGLVLSVPVEPGVNFNRLEEIFIVLGPAGGEPGPGEAEPGSEAVEP